MCSQFDKSCRHSCTKSIYIGEKESKLSSTENGVFPQTCSAKSTSIPVCSARESDGHVYKRRKLHGNSCVLRSEEDSTATPHKISGYVRKVTTGLRSQIESVPRSGCSSICYAREDGRRAPLFASNFYQYAFECYSELNVTSSFIKPSVGHDLTSTKIAVANSEGSFSFDDVMAEPNVGHCSTPGGLSHFMSKPNVGLDSTSTKITKPNIGLGSTSTKITVANSGHSSSFDDGIAEPLRMFTSLKELCSAVLKTHGLVGGDSTSTTFSSLEVTDDNNTVFLSCKICGLSENPKKMVICDLCEEAFHESCFKSKVKISSDDEWYCQPCLKKKRKIARRVHKGESSEMRKSGQRTPFLESLVSLMLKDVLAHTSKVRIGNEFQAEVPEWSGPNYEQGLNWLAENGPEEECNIVEGDPQ